ncbi:MAG: SRPBCC family protein [Acidimicrobiales bacterium]
MATYRTRIDAAGEPDEVFDYLATFSNAREWDPSVVEGATLVPGPAAVGSVYRLGVRVAGRVVPFEYRVLELDRPRRVVLQARHGQIVSTDTITVEPAAGGSGSLVRYVAVLEGRGLLRLASPLLARFFSTMADRAAAGLRAELA